MRSTKPHVKRWKWGAPGSSWAVDGLRDENGKRIRKFFPSRDAANEWLRERRPELKNQGRATLALTDSQRLDAVRALAVLAPYGASLTRAADEFVARAKQLERTVTFLELRTEIVLSKQADKMSGRYVRDLKNRLARFGQEFDVRPVATIETRELDDWLRALDLSPVSRVNFRKVLRTVFEYAVGRGYVRENPATGTALVKVKSAPPGILKPIELAALLNAASPKILPSIAIAAFAGVRDAEIGRMTWDMVDLKGGHIKIGAGVAKTSSRRIIPLSDNIRAWLSPHAKTEGPIRATPNVMRVHLKEARDEAISALKKSGAEAPNLTEWPNNALRHSFSSYRMAVVGNAAEVAEESGHSVAVMKSSYRELVSKVDGEAWFAIKPPGTGANVISFSKAAGG